MKKKISILIICIFALYAHSLFAAECPHSRLLSIKQCVAVTDALKNGLPVIIKNFEINQVEKTLIVLGEHHIKEAYTAMNEYDLIESFPLRFSEGHSGTGDKNSPLGEFYSTLPNKARVKLRELERKKYNLMQIIF